jgi:DNA gyrase/topoisomerase IV subunit A
MAKEADDHDAGRIAARLAVVDALLWAAEHADELLAIVTSEPTGADAMRRLTSAPYAFTEFQAHHILDLQFRRLSPQNVGLLRAEAERLRHGDITPTTWEP